MKAGTRTRTALARWAAAAAIPAAIGGGVHATEATPVASPKAAGKVAPFDAGVLAARGSRTADKRKWPAWRREMKAGQWKQLPGTSLETIVPEPAVRGNLAARISAWNGLAADPDSGRLFSVGNGGHADYAGNEAYVIDLSADQPRWRMLRPPTPNHEIRASNVSRKEFHDYYADGRPSSTHTYYALQFLGSRNAVFKFGAGSMWGSGNEGNWKTDAFSLINDDWQPAGTWPDIVPDSRGGVIARSVCIDPLTEQVYAAGTGALRRFDPRSGQYQNLAKWPENASAVYARGCAVDTDSKRVVFFGDAYRKNDGGYVYDIRSGQMQRITFTGDDVASIVDGVHNFAWYDPTRKRFLVKTLDGAKVYAVDPQSFVSARLPTQGGEGMPKAENGVHTRWQRMPALGGYAYYPAYRSGVWFLATD